MKRHESGRARARVVSVLLAGFLSAAAAGGAAEPGGGQPEGIKVHGHWTIEIRNPNGSLASRHEFKNALQGGGRSLLAGLLEGVYSDPIWWVELWNPTMSSGPCRHQVPRECLIIEPRSGASGDSIFKNLTVGLPLDSQGAPNGTVELSGSATAAVAEPIGVVRSGWVISSTLGEFTHKTLTPPIEVRPGQIIQVKVVFSFS